MSEIEKYYNGTIHIDFEEEDLICEIIVQHNEIERLNNLLKETSQTLSKQTTKAITLKSENERLNNIINELEKWLLEEHKKKQKWYNEQLSTNDKRYYEEKYLTSLTMINVFFDKIKELKGSDKE